LSKIERSSNPFAATLTQNSYNASTPITFIACRRGWHIYPLHQNSRGSVVLAFNTLFGVFDVFWVEGIAVLRVGCEFDVESSAIWELGVFVLHNIDVDDGGDNMLWRRNAADMDSFYSAIGNRRHRVDGIC
jgi:hypothetical protein